MYLLVKTATLFGVKRVKHTQSQQKAIRNLIVAKIIEASCSTFKNVLYKGKANMVTGDLRERLRLPPVIL